MATKATISTHYPIRMGIIGVLLLGYSGLCLKDGLVTYPRKQLQYQTFENLRDQYPVDWQERWVQVASEKGWPVEQPVGKSDWSIRTQFIQLAIVGPLGLWFALGFIRSCRRWVATDEEGLLTSSGQRVAWGAIKSIDKTRWKNKGIAVVHYGENGSDGRIMLDDWKFKREPTAAILAEVEARTGLGGEPDSEGAVGSEESDGSDTAGGSVEEPLASGESGASGGEDAD